MRPACFQRPIRRGSASTRACAGAGQRVQVLLTERRTTPPVEVAIVTVAVKLSPAVQDEKNTKKLLPSNGASRQPSHPGTPFNSTR